MHKVIKCEETDQDKAPHYKEMAMIVKEHDVDQYYEHVKKAIEMYSMGGRTSQAASLSKECAQQMEENYDYENS